MPPNKALNNARNSLEGLTTGDAFGEKFFIDEDAAVQAARNHQLPEAPWSMTDDSIMAIGIYQVLEECGEIDRDILSKVFARNYMKDPVRGYGRMAHNVLQRIERGEHWRDVASSVFDGTGSYGNGGAMRVAPVGAYFAEDIERVIKESQKSAEITHTHPEGQAGAIAVALASGWVVRNSDSLTGKSIGDFYDHLLSYVPDSETRSGILRARDIPGTYSSEDAACILGNGSQISAQDTVPFTIWCTAWNLGNYEEALWKTVSGLGDRDTTCAIVGGILASGGKETIPDRWIESRESIYGWLLVSD